MGIRVAKPRGCNRDANASVCCTRKAPRRTAFTARPSDQKTHESSTISHNFAFKGAHISIELMHTFECVCECVQTQNRNKYTGILIKSRRGMRQRNHTKSIIWIAPPCLLLDRFYNLAVRHPLFEIVKKTNWFSYKWTFGAHPTGSPQRSNSWYRRMRAREQN